MGEGWTWSGGGGGQGALKSKSDYYKRTQELDFSKSLAVSLSSEAFSHMENSRDQLV